MLKAKLAELATIVADALDDPGCPDVHIRRMKQFADDLTNPTPESFGRQYPEVLEGYAVSEGERRLIRRCNQMRKSAMRIEAERDEAQRIARESLACIEAAAAEDEPDCAMCGDRKFIECTDPACRGCQECPSCNET